MLAFSDVLDFFTHELAGLGRGSFPFALFAPRSSYGSLFGHGGLQVVILNCSVLQSGFHSGVALRQPFIGKAGRTSFSEPGQRFLCMTSCPDLGGIMVFGPWHLPRRWNGGTWNA